MPKKKKKTKAKEKSTSSVDKKTNQVNKRRDPNELLNEFLNQNGLKLDFGVIVGTIQTPYGIIKLTEKTLVVKASYVKQKSS